jgi:hypothetical protein
MQHHILITWYDEEAAVAAAISGYLEVVDFRSPDFENITPQEFINHKFAETKCDIIFA